MKEGRKERSEVRMRDRKGMHLVREDTKQDRYGENNRRSRDKM